MVKGERGNDDLRGNDNFKKSLEMVNKEINVSRDVSISIPIPISYLFLFLLFLLNDLSFS
jgi:hypothetical protein